MRAAFLSRLTIGLVGFNIKAYTVVSEKEFSLKLLHGPCLAPIEERKFCSSCGQHVTDPVRGTEIPSGAKSKWIVFTRDDIASLIPDDVKGPKNIEIQQVITFNEINPLWLGPSYYLVPVSLADSRSYSVVSRAFREEKVAGVATLAYYKKIRLCVIYPGDESLLLRQVYYAQSIRDLGYYGVTVEQDPLTRKEVALGRQLLKAPALRQTFIHGNYVDPVPGRLAELVQSKTRGKPLETQAPAPDESPKVIDLTEALRASIQQLGRKRKTKMLPLVSAKKARAK